VITFIKGKLVRATPALAIVEVGGLGYKILIPASTYPHLPQIGEDVFFHTALIVREISQTLYGFIIEEERDCFEEVIGISGIGPKTAINLIGHLPIEKMHQAVTSNDIASICKVPGIGKKTAERLMIEMRDRYTKSSKHYLPSDFAIKLESDPEGQKITDAMNALINLGYNQSTAQKAIKKSLKMLPDSVDLPTLITNALNHV